MQRFTFALVALMILSRCAGDDAGNVEPSHHDVPSGNHSPLGDHFQALLDLVALDAVPRTPSEIVAISDVIAFGRLADVRDGRTIDYQTGASNPMHTAVYEVAIDEQLKGASEDRVFVELLRSIVAPVEALRAHLPSTPIVVVLQHPTWSEQTYRFEDEGAGLPDSDTTLYSFALPIGLAAEWKGSLFYPLARDEVPANRQFTSNSLDELRSELQSLIASASP